MSLADELAKLQQLRDAGTLTEQEFQTAKRTLLNPASPPAPSGPSPQYNTLGEAANRYVSFQIVMSVIGIVVFLIVIFTVFLPAMNGSEMPYGPVSR